MILTLKYFIIDQIRFNRLTIFEVTFVEAEAFLKLSNIRYRTWKPFDITSGLPLTTPQLLTKLIDSPAIGLDNILTSLCPSTSQLQD